MSRKQLVIFGTCGVGKKTFKAKLESQNQYSIEILTPGRMTRSKNDTIKNANLIFLVYTITDLASFEQLDGFLTDITKASNTPKEELPILIIGTLVFQR